MAQLSVISWNVQLRPIWIFPFDSQIERSMQINKFIIDNDIVVLQETFESKCFDILTPGFQFKILPSGVNHLVSNGIMILSKLPIDFYQVITFENCSGFDCLSPKGAVLFQITRDSTKYQFIATHLQSGEGRVKDLIRISQIKQIKDLMCSNFKVGIKQIVLGDLNQSNGVDKFEEILELKSANGDGFTWFSGRKTQLLDYVLSDFRLDNFSIERVELSDHYPIKFTF